MAEVLVTVQPGSDLNAVEKGLKSAGFEVGKNGRLDFTNQFVGVASEQDLPRIRSVEGVSDASVTIPVYRAK